MGARNGSSNLLRFITEKYIHICSLKLWFFLLDNNKKSKRQYAEDIEEERKRVKRCEEHASRFTRSVYQLGLQARDVHTEIEQCAGQSLTAEKKVHHHISQGNPHSPGIDFRRQILMSKVSHCTEIIKNIYNSRRPIT